MIEAPAAGTPTAAVAYRISIEDYVCAIRLHARPTPRAWAGLLTLLLLLAAVAILASGALQSMAVGGLGGGLLVLGAMYALLPRSARRHYRKYHALQGDFAISLGEDGVHLGTENSVGTVVWRNMIKWRHDQRYLLIYVMPPLFHLVPKRLADDGFDIERLQERLAAQLGPAR